jgi:hypothetical protein
MIGPLPTAPGGFNRVLVAIDKFTKWIEVKPVTCPKADRVLDFLDELVHRYGLPHHIITDLGSNFNNHQFWEYCESMLTVNSCIKVRLDLQADKSPVVVKGPFFPRVVNPRYRIRVTMCNARVQSSKARKAIL